ncbi:hypothetical protein AYI68_g5242 [Smittium mucronatum]|uniref:Glutathione S-transferase n=1 Tax=Smittium mucronatum TaxID=133383 RepID=A0A1R0GUV3_9FUNG|nr:hypothetical protein AYI68_g5242 [Smittium mucronatum]
MKQFKIIYLPIPGRAYVSRLMLSFAGIDYSCENSVPLDEKTEVPYNGSPIFEEFNTETKKKYVLNYSAGIERYLGIILDLEPKTSQEVAVCYRFHTLYHEAIEKYMDLKNLLREYATKNPAEVSTSIFEEAAGIEFFANQKVLVSHQVIKARERLESLLIELFLKHEHYLASSEGLYYFGDYITYIDLQAYALHKFCNEKFPKLKFSHLEHEKFINSFMPAASTLNIINPLPTLAAPF